MRDDFAVFILSHKRAHDISSLMVLEKTNYSGKLYIIVDDMDDTVDEYLKLYGDKVIVFDKRKYAQKTDTCDNFNKLTAVVYARNASFDIAKSLGLRYFAMWDDDLTNIEFRYAEDRKLKSQPVYDLDGVYESFIDYMEKSPYIYMLGFGTPLHTIGGVNGAVKKGIAFGSSQMMLCDVERRINFTGTMFEDTCTMMRYCQVGKLFVRVTNLLQHVKEENSAQGGMKDSYVNKYTCCCYMLMQAPNITKIRYSKGDFNHVIMRRNMVPKIVSEEYKK